MTPRAFSYLRPDVQPLLVLRRLALTKREREVAATRAHMLDTGNLCATAAAAALSTELPGLEGSLALGIVVIELGIRSPARNPSCKGV